MIWRDKIRTDKVMVCCTFAALVMLFPVVASATQDPSGIATILCNVIGIVMGNMGRGVATLGIIIVGVMALLGKANWGFALTVVIGVAVIFNAPTIITAITSGSVTGVSPLTGC